MSHIMRGKVAIAFNDEAVLRKALATLGNVLENQHATIATGTGTFARSPERYPLVLESSSNKNYRMGFKKEADGNFHPFFDEWGDLGRWCKEVNAATQDRYIAYHYEKELTSEGYKVAVHTMNDGSLEVVGMEEATW